jgi:Na+/glutamate symporter
VSERGTEYTISFVEIILAGVIAVALAEGTFDVWDFIVGLLLLIVIHAFLDDVPKKPSKRAAIAGIAGIACTLIIGSSLIALGLHDWVISDLRVVAAWLLTSWAVYTLYFPWKQRRNSFEK